MKRRVSYTKARGTDLIRLVYLLLLCGLVLGYGTNAQAQTAIITIDAPGAGTGSYQGTLATAINAAGVIAGYYLDSNWGCHGFVRNPEGTYISFDTPLGQHGAATCPIPTAINHGGAVTGVDSDGSFGCANWPDTAGGCGGSHGFVRQANGTLNVFDGPINPSFSDPGTAPTNISSTGVIVGQYFPCDQSSCSTSFLRTPDGTFSTFDAPGSNAGGYSLAVGILTNGSIAGYFTDYNWIIHGYIRAADGSFAVIDAPGAVLGTWIYAINSKGDVVGSTEDANYQGSSYLRTSDGTFTNIDVPNGVFTRPAGINNKGTVVGTFATTTTSGRYSWHVFLRAADDTLTTFDVPGGPVIGSGGISSSNAVVGYYQDANGVYHGFLRPGH